MNIPAGTRIGRYEVRSKIGEGGMGEVYLANDQRLGRKVALKLLTENLKIDEQARKRFVQEARATSALNHPNIIAIYDVDSDEHRDFIAMEYVEGESLRNLLASGKVDVKRAVEFAAQAASALAAAHQMGVIHRDIKPDNLMITPTGLTKILDFGLAKLIEKQRGAAGLSEFTTAFMDAGNRARTSAGAIIGTVSYMSPEQARGENLDHRTDIFSLGVVLYEMLTGERPFAGKSVIDTLHAIINQDPASITEINPQLPFEATEILSKALAKDAGERYQHAGDFELDLRRFKRALESNSLMSARTKANAPAPNKPSRTTWFWVAGATLVCLGIAAVLWIFTHAIAPSTGLTIALSNLTLTPLTTEPGYEGEPTFSPDGETIAYVSDRTGNFDIFLKQVSGGPDVQLTTSTADDVQPSFSPDGKQIAFVSTRSSQAGLYYPVTDSPLIGGDIWVMTALGDKGGNAHRIVEHGNFPSWSPDGKFILYMNDMSPPGHSHLYQVPSTGGEPREVPLKFTQGSASGSSTYYPRYSSDGGWISFQMGDSIYVVSAGGGEPQFIARGMAPTWDADSSAIIYSSKEPGKNLSLWRIPFSLANGKTTGSASPLTVSRGWDMHAAVSRDGKMIAFTGEDVSFNVETMPFDAEQGHVSGNPKPLTAGQNINFFVNFSPDARSIVFESTRGSSTHIWRADADSPPVQLTSAPNFNDTCPRWSPDGRHIAFNRTPVAKPGPPDIWLMADDGANPQLLAEKVSRFAWMPDSRAMVGYAADERQFVVIDLETKQRRTLTNEPGVVPIVGVTSDGKWAAYHSQASGNMDIRAISLAGGASRAIITSPYYDVHPFFSPSGRWLYFQRDHKNIYRVPGPAQDWRPAEPQKVSNFPESGLFLEDAQISPDGRWLLYSRGRITGDIWIMKLGEPSQSGRAVVSSSAINVR
jgi:serine/threonine protein kinase